MEDKKDFRKRLKELGYNLDEEGVNVAFSAFQELGYRKPGRLLSDSGQRTSLMVE